MDGDDIRHGKPSVQKWDISTAILSGDAISLSTIIITISQNAYKDLMRYRYWFEGQALDKEFENDNSISMIMLLDY